MDPRLSLLLVLLASPVLVFAINIAVHHIYRRLGRAIMPQRTVLFCALWANVPVLAGAWLLAICRMEGGAEQALGMAFALCLHNVLGCFYYQCFALSENSLHIHALVKVHLGAGAEMDAEADAERRAMDAHAETGEAMAVRLVRLVELGQIREENGRYYSTGGVFLVVARLFDFWRALLGCGDPLSRRRGS